MQRMRNGRQGFTLVEMVLVLAVTGLMIGFLLESRQATAPDLSCYLTTKSRLNYLHRQIELFARDNERLPMPAKRYVGPENVSYGREATGAAVTQAAGVSFGAFPFQALGLGPAYAGDCWGNKYSYAVTTALTTSASSGGYKDSTVKGNITLEGDGGHTVNSEIAYAIISHGEDALGAVKVGYDDSTSGTPDRRWCAGSVAAAYINCLATAATLREGSINNGKNAGVNYFDDLITAGGKPQILSTADYYLYGWGSNVSYGLASGYDYVISSMRELYTSALGLTFAQVSLGGDHACGLTAAGVAYCWGNNLYGQLGDGTYLEHSAPAAVVGGLTFSTIVAGDTTTCGITTGHDAYCWGNNSSYQLANGTTNNSDTPVLIGSNFTAITVGDSHICAINTSNDAYCWGDNTYGRLGDGTTTARNTPTAVTGGHKFSSIEAGSTYTCAVATPSGSGYCWGYNIYGQLGNGASGFGASTNSTPVQVGAGTPQFKHIYAARTAGYATCGITTSDTLYCWGYNLSGQVGIGNTTSPQPNPVAVTVSGISGRAFSQMSIATLAVCALTTNNESYCWGNSSTTPQPTKGGVLLSSLSVNAVSKCGIRADGSGKIYCWGTNGYGEISPYAQEYRRIAIPANGIRKFTAVSTHSNGGFVCGLDASGAAYCTGSNSNGTLGNGSTTASKDYVAVSGGLTFSSIYTGPRNTCGLTSDGTAYCWGNNSNSQLANAAATSPQTTPIAVTTALKFSKLTIGNGHVCGIDTTNTTYCWGYNFYGQLGTGSTGAAQASPVAVTGGHTFTKLSAGYNFTCGIDGSGATYCWGQNFYSTLGNAASGTTNQATPVLVDGGHVFTDIASSYNTTCALNNSGAAYCWGYNQYAQLGNAASGTTQQATPVAVDGGHTFTKISTGFQHTCGLTSGGIYCWGLEGTGILGNYPNVYSGAGSIATPALVYGSNTLTYSAIAAGSGFTVGLVAAPASTCTDLWTAGKSVAEGMSYIAYQSAAPSGACTSEMRTCSAGSFSGSYTNQSCVPGCDGRTISWGTSPICSATIGAYTGGESHSVPTTAPATSGSVTATCSANGELTLSGASCS